MPRVGGIKGRFFNGKNASGAPFAALIVGIFGISYTLDYNSKSFFINLNTVSHLILTLVHLSMISAPLLLGNSSQFLFRASQEPRSLIHDECYLGISGVIWSDVIEIELSSKWIIIFL